MGAKVKDRTLLLLLLWSFLRLVLGATIIVGGIGRGSAARDAVEEVQPALLGALLLERV
jgi:hypothetical protein